MYKNDKDVFNVLFEAVSEGVIVVNNNQIIVSTNASAERMFGYQKNELMGRNLNILIP